jgi:glycosyltransferase involved in cell wall biosynthesis
MIEAMSSGVKVIATDIPEISEVIDNNKNGILIENNTESEMYLGVLKA